MKFDISNYEGGYVVMHCPTLESAKVFLDYLTSVGRTWNNGRSYQEYDHWNDKREETCYRFNRGTYCDRSHYETEEECVILCFYDFEWDGFDGCLAPAMSFDEMFYGTKSAQTEDSA